MKALSRFEADLLRLLHALLGRAPIAGAQALLATRRERPDCLSRDAVALVQDALAKGCVLRLAREGGWLHARHLRNGRVAAGRLWERSTPEALGLRFTAKSLEFLLWLACDELGRRPAACEQGDLADGDRMVLFLAYESLRSTPHVAALRALPAFATHGLCRLAFPEDFADAAPVELDFGPWCGGPGAFVLEALQPLLARRWVAVEELKRGSEPARLRALARAQAAVLDALLPALDAAGRRDLARFLLEAARQAFPSSVAAPMLVPRESLRGLRVAERTETQRAAFFLLSALERLRAWEQAARGVGYFDEGYAAAQLWKADWEVHGGEALCAQGRAFGREVDPLHH